MRIGVELPFNEVALVRLLKWLRDTNVDQLREGPTLPLLYESGAYYVREERETWRTVLPLLARGKEDCDSLAAYRAAELIARGGAALRPGDPGYEESRGFTGRIHAEVVMTTRGPVNRAALYHCICRFRLGSGSWQVDDPSARLGMNGSLDPTIAARWNKALGPTRTQEIIHAFSADQTVVALPQSPLSGADWYLP